MRVVLCRGFSRANNFFYETAYTNILCCISYCSVFHIVKTSMQTKWRPYRSPPPATRLVKTNIKTYMKLILRKWNDPFTQIWALLPFVRTDRALWWAGVEVGCVKRGSEIPSVQVRGSHSREHTSLQRESGHRDGQLLNVRRVLQDRAQR